MVKFSFEKVLSYGLHHQRLLSEQKQNTVFILTAEKIIQINLITWFTLLGEEALSLGGAPLEAAALEVLLTGSATALAGLVQEKPKLRVRVSKEEGP